MKTAETFQNPAIDQSIAVYHHWPSVDSGSISYTWEEQEVADFDELIISWNLLRPQYGEFKFLVSVKIQEIWTSWFPYASWGANGQKGGDIRGVNVPLYIDQDIVSIRDKHKANGFRIRLEASEGAFLDECYAIHACASSIEEFRPDHHSFKVRYNIDLKLPLMSQMQLSHPRCRDMCSAVATSSAVSYLLNKNRIDPIFFALQSRDEAFDIFGNWSLNTAHASAVLGKNWNCWVQRLNSFDDIYERLLANTPVVVSVKGPLKGSALPYSQGHLLAVKGYRNKDQQVLCMDPAFSVDSETDASYDLDEFLAAWARRQNIAYLFERKTS
jgi:hypothetical protein